MIEFIESPIYANWLQKNVPKHKLVICSPFIVKYALVRLIDFYEAECQLGEYELLVVVRARKKDFTGGSSDISALEYLSEIQKKHPDKITVKIVNNLHMKAYAIDDEKLLITSGNLTPKGIIKSKTEGNVEGGLATDDIEAITAFNNYLQNIINAGKDVEDFIKSNTYHEIKSTSIEKNNKKDSKEIIDSLYYVEPPKELLEYPETTNENSRFKRFGIVNNIDINNISIDIRDYIPQNVAIGNYLKTMQFICENNQDSRTMEGLAQHLGTTAVKEGSKARKPSGVLKNLKLLGLIENERPNIGVLPEATELGEAYYKGNLELQVEIIRDQSKKLPWMPHIQRLREDNLDQDLGKIIVEYLCNHPVQYAESTAARYRPAMLYFCKLNGID